MIRSPRDRIKQARSRNIFFAVVVLLVAVFSAGTAAAGALVTSRQIKDGTITRADVRDGTVQSADLRDGGLLGVDVQDRSLAAGDFASTTRAELKGPRGPQGPAGGRGLGGLELLTSSQPVAPNANATTSLRCPAGKVALSIAGSFVNGAQTFIRESDATGLVFVHNRTPNTHDVTIRLLCGVVAP